MQVTKVRADRIGLGLGKTFDQISAYTDAKPMLADSGGLQTEPCMSGLLR
jgi:hypothetical protein